MLDVLMHQPDRPIRSFVDSLQAFWPGLQVCLFFSASLYKFQWQILSLENGSNRNFLIANYSFVAFCHGLFC